MVSLAPITDEWTARDEEEENRRLNAEYAWLDDYPAEGDWVWGMEPSRLRLLSRLHDYEFDSD
jgi:hypothetical protein